MVTAPLVTLRMLKPTVGIMSSWKPPVATTFTKDVFPAFCRPISDSSISFLKNRLQARKQTACHRLRDEVLESWVRAQVLSIMKV